MPITVTYAETRTSTITVTAEQARELLHAAGRPAATDLSDADLAAVMQDELAAVDSNLPEHLEPRVDEMAEISHREWGATTS